MATQPGVPLHQNSWTARAPPPPAHQLFCRWLRLETSEYYWLLEAFGPSIHASSPANSLAAHSKTLGWLEYPLNGLGPYSRQQHHGPSGPTPKALKYEISNKAHFPYMPRCDYFHIRSMPIFLIVQRSASVGRRLQPSRLDPSFIWLVRYHCQGVMRNFPKDLNLSKNFDSMQSPICLSSSRTVSEWSRKISKWYAKVFPEEYIHRISLTAGDNLGPLLASFPVMVSRTHGNSFFWVEILFIEKISRFEFMKLFSTSQCLLIRTIYHLPELFANVASTYLDLACDLGLFCSCLRVLVVLMSKYLSSMSCFLYDVSLTMSSLLAKTLSSVIFSSG